MRYTFLWIVLLWVSYANAQNKNSAAVEKISFHKFLSPQQWSQLEAQGLVIIDYLGDNTYLLDVPNNFDFHKLNIQKQSPSFRLDVTSNINEDLGNKYAINFRKNTSLVSIQTIIQSLGLQVEYTLKKGRLLVLNKLPDATIIKLEKNIFVKSIESINDDEIMVNFESGLSARTNLLENSPMNGQLGLNGENVAVGVGDGGKLGNHLDLLNNVFFETEESLSSFGAHGDHVAGTIGGDGIIDPNARGIVPEADLIIGKTSQIYRNTNEYFGKYNMVLTNNSWGPIFNCSTAGTYNSFSEDLDEKSIDFEKVLHVWAVGNFGNYKNCNGTENGYGTVLGYYASAKNILSVGNVDIALNLDVTSSKGPCRDGRVKPEICAIGNEVYSTGRNNNYFYDRGTSMAAPSVTGVLAMMYQKYRQIFDDEDPDAALMKAILCNTGLDRGNYAVDYKYGFGVINAQRAVNTIDKKNFKKGIVEAEKSAIFDLEVPDNLHELKLMLYYHDSAGKLSERALINNLDLKLVTPMGDTINPWVLNNQKGFEDQPAKRGVDNINNIEQITILNPMKGNYTIVVNGKEIPFGNHDFYLTWDFVKPGLVMTYPNGGESITSGAFSQILWDYYGENDQEFKIEYTVNGKDWELVKEKIASDQRMIEFKIPNLIASKCLFKISTTDNTESISKKPIHILPKTKILKMTNFMDKQIFVEWDKIAGIEEYVVYVFDGNEMKEKLTTKNNKKIISGNFKEGDRIWVSIATKNGGFYGNRIMAKSLVIQNDSVVDVGNPKHKTINNKHVFYPNISFDGNRVELPRINIKVFPNPIIDHVNLEVWVEEKQEIGIEIFDNNGKKMIGIYRHTTVGVNHFNLNTFAQFPKGIYSLIVTTSKGVQQKRLVKF